MAQISRDDQAIITPAIPTTVCGKLNFATKLVQESHRYKMYLLNGTDIRGHRPNYSLGGKILANREGDYESCFREGEEKYKPGYGKGMGRKFSLANFFLQNQGGKKKILKFLLFSPIRKIFCFFEASGRG